MLRVGSFNGLRWQLLGIMLIASAIAGCAQSSSRSGMGPGVTSDGHPLMMSTWAYAGHSGRSIQTDHYLIHTTIENYDFLEQLATVMEGAYQHYETFAPSNPTVPASPLECYVFANRDQWASFTRGNTGTDAAIYLQINRGGYTVRDWFVAYNIGDAGTYAVASHEGWHQYVARHFHSRLPPFLEEGIATMFENINWDSSTPVWNLVSNPSRADKLRTAIEDGHLWPLDQLCTMHAGDVVSLSGERIETFYAQNWAFAQFLWNAEGGRYRPAFQKMLADLASGAADEFTGRRKGPPDTWDPRTVKLLLEHYMGMSVSQIDEAYARYVKQIAFSVRDRGWSSS